MDVKSSYKQINWQIYPPIQYRFLEHHYTKCVDMYSHIGRSTLQLSIDPLNTIIPNMLICTISYWQIYWQINSPSSIVPMNTTTPNMFICTTSYWHIYWQIYPPTVQYIMGCIWQPYWILQEKVGIYFYF